MANALRFIFVLILTCAFTYLVVRFENVTDGLGAVTGSVSWLFSAPKF